MFRYEEHSEMLTVRYWAEVFIVMIVNDECSVCIITLGMCYFLLIFTGVKAGILINNWSGVWKYSKEAQLFCAI